MKEFFSWGILFPPCYILYCWERSSHLWTAKAVSMKHVWKFYQFSSLQGGTHLKKIPDVAHIFLSGEYDSLYSFFKKTWEASPKSGAYLFRTYYSRKCASLNEHFFQIALENASADEKDALLKLRRETFLTQSGLLLKAPALGAYYIQHSCFPPILMSDELLVSGRDFAETVGRLYRAIVFELLLQGSALTNSEQTLLYSRLLQAIDFYCYTRADIANGTELLLDQSVAQRIMPCEQKPQTNWHVFLNNISTMISFSSVTQNTAFTPSFHLRGDFYSSLSRRLQSSRPAQNWSKERWQYRNRPRRCCMNSTLIMARPPL